MVSKLIIDTRMKMQDRRKNTMLQSDTIRFQEYENLVLVLEPLLMRN